MNTKPMLSLAAVSGLVSLIVLSACSGKPKDVRPSSEIVRNVALTAAKRATIPDYLEATGTVRAAQISQIASQMMGNLTEVRVHEGDRVVRGQVLAVIDDSQPRAALDRASAARNAAQQEAAAAESDFHLADATFKRYRDLYDKKSVSPQEFDEIKARFQSAQARRDLSHATQAQAQAGFAQAETAQAYSRVRAPFDGIVTEKKADTGTLAGPAMPLFTVEDPRRYRLEASVDESDLSLLRIGQAVTVRMDALDQDLPGKVSQILPAADSNTRSFLVKIDLPANPRLHSGMFGRALISRGQKSAVLARRSSFVTRGQLEAVYVVEASGAAALRYVTLGNSYGDDVEVLSGLDGSETLIANPANQELAGKKIEAR